MKIKKPSFTSFLLVLLFLTVIIFLFIPYNLNLMSSTIEVNMKHPAIIAHRGGAAYAPENTMAAIELAMQSKANMIEIDLHMSKDGELVVIHDKTVDRTTNGTGKVSEMTWEDLRKLDAGSWFGEEFAGQRIPSFQEVLDRVNGQKNLLIEIKSGVDEYPDIDQKVVEVILKNNGLDWCIVQSFDDQTLIDIQQQWPQVQLQKLIVFKFRLLPMVFDGTFSFYSKKKYQFVDAINPHYKFVNRRLIQKLHNAGFQVNVWGGKSEDSYEKINHIPVDGWITDFPDY